MNTARFRYFALVAGPLLAALVYWVLPKGEATAQLSEGGALTLAMAVWMVLWWITEATSIYVTALLPLVMLPMGGLQEMKEVAQAWGHPIIFLSLGGFTLAVMLEKWGLHERFARGVLRITGERPKQIVGGFMLVGALLSMWISNTSAAIIMLPVALGILARVPKHYEHRKDFAAALLLGICYSCSVGGMTTIVGTGTNMFFLGYVSSELGRQVEFLDWMVRAMPLALVFLPLAWWLLTSKIFHVESGEFERAHFKEEAVLAQHWSRGEVVAAVAFTVIAGAWVFAPWLQKIPGLASLDSYQIGVIAMFVCFALPTGDDEVPFLLTWKYAVARIPWGVLLIIGGGLALAKAVTTFGVAEFIAQYFSGLQDLPPVVLVAICAGTMVFLTEITTNVASVTALSPIISAIAIGAGLDPLVLVMPITVAASFAFMLPVATPPNAIVFGSGEITSGQMARAGLILNLVAIVLISIWSMFVPAL